jgi:glutathione synthase/RimK-type ligase-like ATP-grasp enzyme
MTVLILGYAADLHAAQIYRSLERLGILCHYWNVATFPTQAKITWSPLTQSGTLRLADGRSLAMSQIRSVFWRNFSGVKVPKLPHESVQKAAYQDAIALVRSLLQIPSIHWVNPVQAYQIHREKPLELSKVHQLGVNVPDTIVTNNPTSVQEFVDLHSKTTFKPIYGGARTQLISAEHLNPERLQLSLKIAPVTLREYIAGANIRSYVIGETVYAAEICSAALDFHEDDDAKLVPIVFPEVMCRQAMAIAKALSAEWITIDWRLTPNGDYLFLEANPNPSFLDFEQQTGFPITQALIELLTS